MQRSMESRNLSPSEELCITTPASLDPEQMEGERTGKIGYQGAYCEISSTRNGEKNETQTMCLANAE